MAHVVILGGGFGGLAAAHELRDLLPGDEITLVDRADRFYMGFAKLWDLSGVRPLEDGTALLSGLSNRSVQFVHADIGSIDPQERRVETSEGTLDADALLVALGAGPLPGHLELLQGDGAHDLYDARQLPAMRQALDQIDRGRVVVAILGVPLKCPPAPYEAAFIVDERLRQRGVRRAVAVAVATPQPMTLPVAGPDASAYLAGLLAERDIELLSQHVVQSVDPTRGVIGFDGGREEAYRLLLGVPACAPPQVVRDSPLAAPSGWIEPHRHSLRTAFDHVYAVGDCTLIPTANGQLPKAGVFAAAQGTVAARNIAADLRGGVIAAFDGVGHCYLELPGRKVALVEGNFLSDPPEVGLTEADEDNFRQKQDYERDTLAAWLG